MTEEDFTGKKPVILEKLIIFLEDIWPSFYRIINDIIYGIIGFIKDLVSSLWR